MLKLILLGVKQSLLLQFVITAITCRTAEGIAAFFVAFVAEVEIPG
jgi:hypothetical protein